MACIPPPAALHSAALQSGKGVEDVEILQKAMATILKSQQLRDVLVYTTLLFVFAIVWVSYRWPDLAVPAVVIACILLGGEVLLICFSVKNMRRQQ
jgi:hypothetical protein